MKNYLVIGGSSGIGKALVRQLAEEQHQVYTTYNSTTIDENISGVYFRSLDVLKDELNFDFLPESLDGIVYCPGSINLKPFTRIKPEAFLEDYKLQVIGAIKTLQAVLPKLKKSSNASVVLFSTVAVQQGFNFHSQVAASKGAIEGLARSLAAEFAPSIRVNCIAPSLTNTPLAEKLLNSEAKKEANAQRHPLKRVGEAEDIANAVSFLLSQNSSWTTGQILHVDGGLSTING